MKRTRIDVRAGEDEKEVWQQYASTSGVTLSDLVRYAVNSYIDVKTGAQANASVVYKVGP